MSRHSTAMRILVLVACSLMASCSGVGDWPPPPIKGHVLVAYCSQSMVTSVVSLDENPSQITLHQGARCRKGPKTKVDSRVDDLLDQAQARRSWELETSDLSHPPGCTIEFQGEEISFDLDVTEGAAFDFVHSLNAVVVDRFGEKCALEPILYLEDMQSSSE